MRHTSILLLIGTLLLGCYGVLLPLRKSEISGFVFNKYTRKPLAEINVDISFQKDLLNQKVIATTRTDLQGRFRVNAEAHAARFLVSAYGYGINVSWFPDEKDFDLMRNGVLAGQSHDLSIAMVGLTPFQPTFSNQNPSGKDDKLVVTYLQNGKRVSTSCGQERCNGEETFTGDSLAFRERLPLSVEGDTFVTMRLTISRKGQVSVRQDSVFCEVGKLKKLKVIY